MKSYMIIEGNYNALEAFELKVAEALEAGYNFAGELISHTVGGEIRFYQPVVFDPDYEDEDMEDDEEDEDEE